MQKIADGVYIYRKITIFKYRKGPGWFIENNLNIYKTLSDCQNAIDEYLGPYSAHTPKRWNEAIRIIGQWEE